MVLDFTPSVMGSITKLKSGTLSLSLSLCNCDEISRTIGLGLGGDTPPPLSIIKYGLFHEAQVYRLYTYLAGSDHGRQVLLI